MIKYAIYKQGMKIFFIFFFKYFFNDKIFYLQTRHGYFFFKYFFDDSIFYLQTQNTQWVGYSNKC